MIYLLSQDFNYHNKKLLQININAHKLDKSISIDHKNQKINNIFTQIENNILNIASNIKNNDYIITIYNFAYSRRSIINIPNNSNEKKQLIKKLSGRRHRVYSYISLIQNNKIISRKTVESVVKFKNLSDQDIICSSNTQPLHNNMLPYNINDYDKYMIIFNSGSYGNIEAFPYYEIKNIINQIT